MGVLTFDGENLLRSAGVLVKAIDTTGARCVCRFYMPSPRARLMNGLLFLLMNVLQG